MEEWDLLEAVCHANNNNQQDEVAELILNNDWKNYKEYTSALTNLRDLKLGCRND